MITKKQGPPCILVARHSHGVPPVADGDWLASALADRRTLPGARRSQEENAAFCLLSPTSRAVKVFVNSDLPHVHFWNEKSQMGIELPFLIPFMHACMHPWPGLRPSERNMLSGTVISLRTTSAPNSQLSQRLFARRS